MRCTVCRTTYLNEPESLAAGVCITCRAPEPYCRACKSPLEQPESVALRMCSPCRESLARAPLPPPRRQPTPCRGCNNLRFVRFAAGRLLDSPGDLRERSRAEQAQWILLDTFVGALESYTCTECGLVEWYGDPRVITLGAEFASELVDFTRKR